MMYDALFQPIQIGNMQLKNRLVVPAMSTLTAAEDGAATEQFIAYHERKAQGGWGLIITEYYGVAPHVGFFPRMLGIWNDELVESHKKLTERVHAAGAKIAAQISHSGRETYIEVTDKNLVAPSPYMDVDGKEKPRELTVEEIHTIIGQYGDTAYNLKRAGFDAVEIYAAHGYLVSEFLSKYANRRTDEYGGCLENRMRFLLEIIADVKKKVGPDFPVLVRMSTVEYVPGGLSIAETKVLARKLQEAGVAAIDCSQGIFTVSQNIVEPMMYDNCVFVDNSAEIKKVVDIPVITAGRINEACLAESVLLSGKADLIGMGRASLADPDFPKKVQEGRLKDIRYCIGCVQGCIGGNMRGENCHCLVNPELDREFELKPNPVKKKKKVLIAGGGVAGCEAAIVAAQRGHEVVLCEKSEKLGGTWLIASLPPHKGELLTFVGWQRHMLDKLGVTVKYQTEVTPELLDEMKPDAVIVATGCKPFIPPIPGSDLPHVVQANDILQQNQRAGKHVVVMGGGSVGVETAEFLSWYGSEVTIVEMRDDILIGCERETMLVHRKAVKDAGMKVYTEAKMCEIGENSVTLERKGEIIVLHEIDNVVVAAGSRPVNTLEEVVKEKGIPVMVVGDSKKVRNGLHAIYEGYMAGYEV